MVVYGRASGAPWVHGAWLLAQVPPVPHRLRMVRPPLPPTSHAHQVISHKGVCACMHTPTHAHAYACSGGGGGIPCHSLAARI